MSSISILVLTELVHFLNFFFFSQECSKGNKKKGHLHPWGLWVPYMYHGWDIWASFCQFHWIPWRVLNPKGKMFSSNCCSSTPMTLTPNMSSWYQSRDRKLPTPDAEIMFRRGYGLGPVIQSDLLLGAQSTFEPLNLGTGGHTQSPSWPVPSEMCDPSMWPSQGKAKVPRHSGWGACLFKLISTQETRRQEKELLGSAWSFQREAGKVWQLDHHVPGLHTVSSNQDLPSALRWPCWYPSSILRPAQCQCLRVLTCTPIPEPSLCRLGT